MKSTSEMAMEANTNIPSEIVSEEAESFKSHGYINTSKWDVSQVTAFVKQINS